MCLVALLAPIAAGCPATAWEAVAGSQDVDKLWQFIQENPDDPRADELRVRIASIEFEAAKEANTRFAYNAFLERHPETSMALEARRRLEALDFEQAKASGSPEALAAFLRRHPAGRFADQARALRAESHCKRLAAETDADHLARELVRLADLPCRPLLEDQLKKLRLAEALASGQASRLLGYVQSYGQDAISAEARHRLLRMQVDALIQAARFDRARKAVQERADADQAEGLLARLSEAESAWQRASFADGQVPRKARAGRQRLAEATRRLRAPRGLPTDPAIESADPRQRWLAADRLAHLADEAAADALLTLLDDAFIEVRRRAAIGLKGVVERLGPVRGQIWLETQRRKLSKTAKAGKLLFRRAVLTDLAGEPAIAWTLLSRLLAESEQPDLLALAQASRIAKAVGFDKDSARTARTFSDQAHQFAKQRIEAWRRETGVSRAAEAWLILRQLHGLAVVWAQVIAPFQDGPDGPARVEQFQVVLGPWLERSERRLEELRRWLRDEESRWARTHKGYQPSADAADHAVAPAPGAPRPGDVPLLALAAGGAADPTLTWAACCHPDPATRLSAATWLATAGLVRGLAQGLGGCVGP